jgi:Uma2 family endonuclease
MSRPAKKIEDTFTYGEYLTWSGTERWELIHGVTYDMSPAPSTEHQSVLLELAVAFRNFLRGKSCQVYIAPFDVRLPESGETDEEIKTVVQPDISVICDPSKIDDKGCKGAPDLIIEILSPSTAKKDTQEKLALYEQCGVKEYWIVHPSEFLIEVFHLNDQDVYSKPTIYASDDLLPVKLLPDLEIDLAVVFDLEKQDSRPAVPGKT